MRNVLTIRDRAAFRAWLAQYGQSEEECWVQVKRGRPSKDGSFWYLDAVEEALCFGWIDSTTKAVDGVRYQRFSPRREGSPWTELNKERVRRLIALGLLTPQGLAVAPPLGPRSFRPDPDVVAALKDARVWSTFCTFPPLYRRVRLYNVAFYKERDPQVYRRALDHLVEETRAGRTYGEWNDYGRLLDY
ncbi:MAG: thymidylate synthase [Clostridia bacterium]|nr:thymidylate synthase [Clostridia bacterium]